MATESQPGRIRKIVIGNFLRVRIFNAIVACLIATGLVGIDCATVFAQSQPVIRVAKRPSAANQSVTSQSAGTIAANVTAQPTAQNQVAPASASVEPGASEQVIRAAVRRRPTHQDDAVEIVQAPGKKVTAQPAQASPIQQSAIARTPLRNTPAVIVPVKRGASKSEGSAANVPIVSVDRPVVKKTPASFQAPASNGTGVVNIARRSISSQSAAQLNTEQLRTNLQRVEQQPSASRQTSIANSTAANQQQKTKSTKAIPRITIKSTQPDASKRTVIAIRRPESASQADAKPATQTGNSFPQIDNNADPELADPNSYLVKSQLPLNIRSFDERRRNFEQKMKKNRTPASTVSYRKYSRNYQDKDDKATDKDKGDAENSKKPDRESPTDNFDDDALNFEIASVNVPLGDTPLGKLNPRNDAGVPYDSSDLPAPSEQATQYQEAHFSPATQQEMTDQMYTPKSYAWNAPNLHHRPLYFEERNLERYGQHRPFQSIRSGAHFFATIPILPYKIGAYPLKECTYTYGYHRPGNCNPNHRHLLPWSTRGMLFEAAAATGAFLAVP